MSEPGEAARIQPRAAAQVEDLRGATRQNLAVDPFDLPVDDLAAAAGRIVILRQVLLEHPPAEVGIVPRDVVALAPGRGRHLSVHKVEKLHGASAPEVPLGWRDGLAAPRLLYDIG